MVEAAREHDLPHHASGGVEREPHDRAPVLLPEVRAPQSDVRRPAVRANAIPLAAECGSRYATGAVTPAQPVPASRFRFQLGQQPGQPKLRPCVTWTSISAGSSPRSSRPFTVAYRRPVLGWTASPYGLRRPFATMRRSRPSGRTERIVALLASFSLQTSHVDPEPR